MNLIDKTISYFAPERGLRRARARAAEKALLAYDGARSARRQGGWNPTGTSGNSEIGVYSARLRMNARDLCRNNAYARKAKKEWSKRVVGTGITPRPDTGNDRANKIIAGLWPQFAKQCCSDSRFNFYSAQKLIVGSCYESGEALVRLWDRRTDDGLAVPLQIQILEADYLDSDKTQTLSNGFIIQGIEFDLLGRIRGYWLFGNHPGEVTQTNLTRGGLRSGFIPAENILHHAEIDRPGDVRAVSRFAAVIAKLQDLNEYADAEMVRKKIEACLAAMVTQPEGPDGATLGSAAVDSTGNKIEEFRPGMIMYGAPGAGVEFFSPPSSGDYAEHKKTELREVAVGLDIPYVVLDDNLEAVNYSSYRGGSLAFRDAVDEYRSNWLIPQVLDPIWRRFIDKVYALGKLSAPSYGVVWDPPPFDLLDREAEAKADRLELQIGKTTWPQLVAKTGKDPEAQAKEIAVWKDRLDEAGVSFASTTSDKDGGNGNAEKSESDGAGETPGKRVPGRPRANVN